MKDSMKQEEISRYKNLITSFVSNAVYQTEGVAKRQSGSAKSEALAPGGNVQVYLYNGEVTVDMFVSVLSGYSVPKVVCDLQEKVIALIKENTPFKPKNINVNVSSVIFM